MTIDNALTRFSDRVDDYLKYRPGYPPQIVEILQQRCGLKPSHVVVDIGSGTGNLARLFLENGNSVFAVEPNPEMRSAGQHVLGSFAGYHSVDGSAEDTHLDSSCADVITAAQAFHWFDWPRARREFRRILRPLGWVVLIWNDRRFDSPFERGYEKLLDNFGTDYAQVKERGGAAVRTIEEFFSQHFETAHLENFQLLDSAGLRGRLLSASYAPQAGHANHRPMLSALEDLFRKHANDGKVRIEYDTNIYFGRV